MSQFKDVCGREQVLDCSSLWALGTEYQDLEFNLMFRNRVMPVCEADDLSWTDIMLPSQKGRLQRYMEKFEHLKKEGLMPDDCDMICDLDQSDGRPRAVYTHDVEVESLMTMVSHGFVFRSGFRRPLLDLDMAQAHGFPVDVERCKKNGLESPLNFPELLRCGMVAPTQLASMCGNGWHIPSVGSWAGWMLSNIELRVFLAKAPQQLSWHGEVDAERDEFESDNAVQGGGVEFATNKKPRNSSWTLVDLFESDVCIQDAFLYYCHLFVRGGAC